MPDDLSDKLIKLLREKYPEADFDKVYADAKAYSELANFLLKLGLKHGFDVANLGNKKGSDQDSRDPP